MEDKKESNLAEIMRRFREENPPIEPEDFDPAFRGMFIPDSVEGAQEYKEKPKQIYV